LLASLLAPACDSDDDHDCTPGVSVDCRGEGSCRGGQTCNTDGRSFGACVCGRDGDGGEDSDGGAMGSRPTGAGSGGGDTLRDGGDGGRGGDGSGGSRGGSGTGGSDRDAGTDAGSNEDAGTDAGIDFGSFACNPLDHRGCPDDERCAWVAPEGDPGETQCLAEGSEGEGDTCTQEADGEDDCERDLVCINDVCVQVCALGDFERCAPEGYCVAYAGLFEEDGELLAGACTLGCDPVTQLTTADESCGTNKACFVMQSETGTVATCAGTGPSMESHTQDFALTGTVFANSCAPGFTPITDDEGDPICSALCTPVETYSGSTANIGGEAPHTCKSRGAGAGYECRFASYFAKHDRKDPLLNTIGVCVNPSDRLWDSNGNGDPETPWPSCAALANTDDDDDGVDDHEQWGCAPASP
jgi:hypothetical protein